MRLRNASIRLVATLICVSALALGQEKEKTVVCPGKGERCAYVEILGIKIWSKKDKGSPGIIIKKTVSEEK